MKLTIISGGQQGADAGALRAARACGIPTGGWAPRGFLTERGPEPGLADYGLKEMPTTDYPARILANVEMASALLWFGSPWSPGGILTRRLATEAYLPRRLVEQVRLEYVRTIAEWLATTFDDLDDEVRLLCAGNRESRSPGIGEAVETFMRELFAQLGVGNGGGA